MASRSSSWLLLALIIAAAAGAVFWKVSALRSLRPQVVELRTGTFLTPSRRLSDFSLIDAHGRRFASANLRGGWSLLFFGYSNCPDFCPATLATLATLEKQLRAAHAAVRPRVIFVSVDAKRDTPEQLARYVPYFDPEFIGLTAQDQPSIEALARAWGVAVIIRPGADGGYSVDHSGVIFVVNPAGRLSAILTGPFSVDTLRQDFERIVAASA